MDIFHLSLLGFSTSLGAFVGTGFLSVAVSIVSALIGSTS